MVRLFLLLSVFNSCVNAQVKPAAESLPSANAVRSSDELEFATGQLQKNVSASTLAMRFTVPPGFARSSYNSDTYGYYLQNLKLKHDTCSVRYFNGAYKSNNNAYAAVVDLPIGTKNLHQCADAVMYLRASYLYQTQQYNQIRFKFLGDSAWHTYQDYCGIDYSYTKFFAYMQEVWSAANTRTLAGQLPTKDLADAAIGDVLIVTGNPYGHAVQIVDECVLASTGKKLYMLAQSYMPAQETQILYNRLHPELGVWYDFEADDKIFTPEWTFDKTALHTW
jgi:hypothetical protein